MLSEFGKVFLFFLFGIFFVAAALAVSWFLRPKRPYPAKLSTYECGEEPVGSSWIRFNIRFYVVALIFLIFEVEILFIFPWAVVFREFGMFGFLEMLVFLGILFVGYAYAWVKGDLDWEKPVPKVPKVTDEQPRTIFGHVPT